MNLTDRGIDDGHGEIRREDVRDASVVPHATDAGYSIVRVRLARDARRVVVADVATARKVVDHLGFGIAMRPWSFSADSPVRPSWVLAALVVASPLVWLLHFSLGVSLLFGAMGFVLLGAITFLVLRMPVKGTVALDGVAIRWLRFARAFPLEAIAEVTCERKGGSWYEVRFDLHDGDDVHVSLDDAEEAEIVAERVREAVDASQLRSAPILAPLLRPPRTTARQWIDRLRGVGSGVVGPRDPVVEADVLWELVESGVARPTDRAAAAVALAATGPAAKERLQRVSAAVTQPRLRVASRPRRAATSARSKRRSKRSTPRRLPHAHLHAPSPSPRWGPVVDRCAATEIISWGG